ncbi:MAG: prolyl oligopeptidase family serine peptidase [Actinomycetes bacterium]
MSTDAPIQAAPQTASPRHRGRRTLIVLAASLGVLLLVFFGGGGWYFSGQIGSDLLDASDTAMTYELTASAVGQDAVRVDGTTEEPLPDVLQTDTVYALRAEDGRVVLSDVLDHGPDWATRTVSGNDGDQYWSLSPTSDGTGQVAVSTDTPVDPYREIWETPADIGLTYDEVVVHGPDGDLPAWQVPGHGPPSSTWAVMVHGKGGTRAEGLRSLITANQYGMYALLVTYRNDTGAFTTDPERYGYGSTEWPDLEASVQYALDQGASEVVLFGYSMGGGIVASFLEHSSLADHVSAVVLDSPMVDVTQTVYHKADQRSLPVVGLPIPDPLTWTALQIARLRYGSDWYDANYLDDTSWLAQPTLVFQGTDDLTVPAATSEQLAAAEPDLVTLVLVPGAGHVESWNVDPLAYHDALRAFLVDSIGCIREPDVGSWCR